MEDFFLILVLICLFVLMPISFFAPKVLNKLFKSDLSRKKLLLRIGILTFVLFILFGISSDKNKAKNGEPLVANVTPTAMAQLAKAEEKVVVPTEKIEPTNIPTNIPTETLKLAPTEKPSPTIRPTSTTKPTPTLTESQIIDKGMADYAKDAIVVTVKDIDKTPNSYLMKKLSFKCKVLGFAKDKSGNIGGINCSDPNSYSSIIQLGTVSLFDFTKINENDTLQILGIGDGSATGKNAFGAEISMGIVNVVYLKDLTTGYKE